MALELVISRLPQCIRVIVLAAVLALSCGMQGRAETQCDPKTKMDGDVRMFVRIGCPYEGSISGYLHFENGLVYIMQDLFSAVHFKQEAIQTSESYVAIQLPANYPEVHDRRESYRDAWVHISGTFAPNGCDEAIWQCPQSKALFRATRVERVRQADADDLIHLKRSLWEGVSPIHEVVAADPDRPALVELGQRLAGVIAQRRSKEAKALFPEVASDALYDKYLKPGARMDWLLFSKERAIKAAAPFKLYRLGSREADVDRVVAYACYNHDANNPDGWPDSYFDLLYAHVSDPFVCYPLVREDGRWFVNFHAML